MTPAKREPLSLLQRRAQKVAAEAQKARQATERRNEAMLAMRDEGATLRAIAEAAQLSHTQVANILKKGLRDGQRTSR